jgi:UDP-2,3-diacylglucosamine hydrolase
MAFSADTLSDYTQLPAGKYLYFASDFHLGAHTDTSEEREQKVVRWLDEVAPDAAAIFLVGDIFDFWFEYKKAIPKGFLRFQSCLTRLRERGIPIYFFTGNHDMWMFDYFPKELGIPVFRRPIILEVGQQRLLVGHGDGLGPGDRWYKFLKKIFEAKWAQWLFRWMHPDVGIWIAQKWSRSSRITSTGKDAGFQQKEGEWLWLFAREMEEQAHFDYYIFGHRHLPLDLPVNDQSTYINLGEWVNHSTYVKYDGTYAQLLTYAG